MSAYMMMWLNYCKQNCIWFSVCGEGSVDEVTFLEEEEVTTDNATFEAPKFDFGTEGAYNWLIRTHAKFREDLQNAD